ncbi:MULTISPECIES: twin-arginine translocase TatA/TatE family subunit [Dermabacter]|uniref:Sec-independent protein translocase protein TatA n=1 Tax=Dermabacter vaginalis TaxID=1630135 RepID=A0ABX6A416_9MICO|nr:MULTISPECIES: twin-arginine translocase TatA/TatE family subunit [Dermabacter]MCG7442633.1 twin-arginine translocase TatA/TatE family subunit [Dermabacter vaginalis]QEU11942.1 twin-arginine translocase TatA/TatE family subunit [Dermabacter vaginalis]
MGTGFIRSPWPILILLVLIVLLFGANKLPGLARNMGESMRIFKSEVSEMRKDDEDGDHSEASIDVKRERGERSYDARDDRDRDYRRDDRDRDYRRDDRDRDYRRDDRDRDYRRDDRDDFRREEPVREVRDREDFLGDSRSDDLYRRD